MNIESLPAKLILASSSQYRKILLRRFGIPFDCQSPEIDETAQDNESPYDLTGRLAAQKAETVSKEHPQAIVIGSDQIAVFDGQIIGKPGTYQAALEQLISLSGRTVEFLTAVSVQIRQSDFAEQYIDCTRVCFRSLQPIEIKRYLSTEKPYDCAGSFKAESLGIALSESITSEDPTALIGLPLIQTAAILRRAGLQLP
jgi:septum formation protein